jgi:prevent-host-death family protein
MKIASISEAKNRLSALIDQVRRGQPVTIVDRGRPVARLESVAGGSRVDADGRLARLERQGLVVRGSRPNPVKLITSPPPKLRRGASALSALLDERRSGR